jgi:hypothetical protein
MKDSLVEMFEKKVEEADEEGEDFFPLGRRKRRSEIWGSLDRGISEWDVWFARSVRENDKPEVIGPIGPRPISFECRGAEKEARRAQGRVSIVRGTGFGSQAIWQKSW